MFAANGFSCPLTKVAESLGAEDGSVTDLYLPGWLARVILDPRGALDPATISFARRSNPAR